MANPTLPVEGSIKWAMNRGKLFAVRGNPAFRYEQMATHSETAQEAAQSILYRGERYSVWVPNETVLSVWRVTGGTTGGWCLADMALFVVRCGQVQSLEVANG